MRAILITVQAGILILLAVVGATDSGERSAQNPAKPLSAESRVSL